MDRLYYLTLYKQFCILNGKIFNENNVDVDTDFHCWLKEISNMRDNYRDYLRCLEVSLFPTTTIELGKGRFDTLGPENVRVVSQYGSTIPGVKSSVLNFASLTPYIFSENNIEGVGNYELFLTHNPYINSSEDIHNLRKLYLCTGASICLGVYGSLTDKTRDKKLEDLMEFGSSMGPEFGFHYDTDNGEYYACVKTEEKKLGKELTRRSSRRI